MTNEQRAILAPVLFLAYETSIGRLVTEVLPEEGYSALLIHTEAEASSLLEDNESYYIVLMDNLHVQPEGRRFLTQLRQNPSLRARVKTVSMAACANDWLRQDFGDVLDAYLGLPFTLDQLLKTLESL